MSWISELKYKFKYIRNKKKLIKENNHSELIINRPDGKDRCSLILTSYDTPQLTHIKESLENRGIKSTLLKDFYGGKTDFKFGLMPQSSNNEFDILKDFNKFLEFTDEYFVYGQPIRDFDFFTEAEKDLLMKWYK